MIQRAPYTSRLPATELPTTWSLADVRKRLGGVPLNRIRLYPPPGMATEEDALALDDHEDVLCELVDGILVEKVSGSFESVLACLLIHALNNYVDTNRIGVVFGAGGPLWILPKIMRIADAAFVRWERFPGGKLPKDRVFRVAPDLAIEVISRGNTRGEMKLKLKEYFQAGVRLVWYVYPERNSVAVYTAADDVTELGLTDSLDGGDVLPGFTLPLKDLFERVPREE